MTVIAGENTTLSYDGTAVADLLSVDGPDSSVAEVETTSLDSTAKTFRPSEIPEQGTISYSFYFDPANTIHAAIQASAKTPETVSHVITVPQSDGTGTHTFTFNAFTTSFALSGMEDEGNLTADVSARITGVITVA